MTKIWKFELPVRDLVTVEMPDAAKVIAVQEQRGAVTLWAQVIPEAPLVKRQFRIIGTGHPFEPDGLVYLGTVQAALFVWHVYEVQR